MRKRVELAGPLRHRELRLDRARLQILPDGIARQPGATRDLADRQLLSQGHAADGRACSSTQEEGGQSRLDH